MALEQWWWGTESDWTFSSTSADDISGRLCSRPPSSGRVKRGREYSATKTDITGRPSQNFEHKKPWARHIVALDGILDGIAETDSPGKTASAATSSGQHGQSPSEQRGGVVLAKEARLVLKREGVLADAIWNISALLELTDSVRSSLTTTKTLGPMGSRLTALLDVILSNEAHKVASARLLIGIDTIRGARLDKLVETLLDSKNQPPKPVPADLFAAKSAARVLQRKWRLRFRDAYISLDRARYHQMLTSGHLREVSFSAAVVDMPDGPALWKTQGREPLSEAEGNQRFSAGYWWLNIICAHRDGFVGSTSQVPTKGRYGIAALPLLSGIEETMDKGRSVYIRESSRLADMHVSLMTQVGRQIRILRGSQLRSMYAPSAGLRYDGLYKIVQHGQKLNEEIEMYRLALVLERVPGQKSMDELREVPKPSHIDDCDLYERLEGERLKTTVSRKNFLAWKTKKMKDKLEHEQWLVSVGLRIGYPHWPASPDDDRKQKATSRQGRRQAISSQP